MIPDAPTLPPCPTLEIAIARYAIAPVLYAVRLKLARARLHRAEALAVFAHHRDALAQKAR